MAWIRIRTPDPYSGSGLLRKFNGDFLVQGYICDKISMKIRSLSLESGDMSQIVDEMTNAPSRNVEESF